MFVVMTHFSAQGCGCSSPVRGHAINKGFHLGTLQGFSLSTLKHLVLDEADRLLNMDFEQEIDQILKHAPRERRTQLFSATMTTKATYRPPPLSHSRDTASGGLPA